MLYVKIMSNEERADNDPWHGYRIIPVENDEIIRFAPSVVPEGQVGNKDGERFFLEISHADGSLSVHHLTGNAYVMNESGKTISSHGC